MNLFSKWNVKMNTMCRHLSLFILLFSIGISIGDAKEQSNQERIRSLPSNTKYYNSLSEISVEKPQTHHRIRHQHTQHFQPSQHTKPHHNTHSSSSPDDSYHHLHVHHRQHNNNHQSNDSASYDRSLPVTQRQNQFEKNNESNVAAARTNDLLSPQFRHPASHQIQASKYGHWERQKLKESSNAGHQYSYPNSVSGVSSWRKHTHRIFPFRTMATSKTSTTTTSTTTPAPVYHFIDKFSDATNDLVPSNNYDDDTDDNNDEDDYDEDDYEDLVNENSNLNTKYGHSARSAFSQNDYFSNENIQQDDPIRNGRSPNLNINRVSTATRRSTNNDDNNNYSSESSPSSQSNRSPTANAFRSSNDNVKTNLTTRSLQTNGVSVLKFFRFFVFFFIILFLNC